MNAPDIFIIDLNSVKSGTETRSCVLDDDFFRNVGSQTVRGGNVRANISISKDTKECTAVFRLEGSVKVPCDRCLELMDIPINATRTLEIKEGEAYCDEGDAITLDRRSPVLDTHWIVYEFIALEIPIAHAHAEGACDAQMMEALSQHLAGGEKAEGRANPCWDKLKDIIINN